MAVRCAVSATRSAQNPEGVVRMEAGKRAWRAGHDAGVGAASWVEVECAEEARRILDGMLDCDPVVMDLCPSPLSGEYAGCSIPELSERYGVDLWDDDNASMFEEAFSAGFFQELERVCAYHAGESL